MPSLFMSPRIVGLSPARPAPRCTVAWGCCVAWAASVGGPARPPGTSTTASTISSAPRCGHQGLPADTNISWPYMNAPPHMTNGWLSENVTERRARGSVSGGAATLWPDSNISREAPDADCGDDGIRRRIDHRHRAAAPIGDVGAVDGRVHSHASGLAPCSYGGTVGVGGRVDHRHVVAASVGDVG